ncbi:hypothetical protein LguiB_032201 [Lonicera macranthoides]
MYVKFDDLAGAHEVFEEMCERDAVLWNSLVCGHIKLGQKGIKDSLDVFRRMQVNGVKPDRVSLIAVHSACLCAVGELSRKNCIYNALIVMCTKCGNVDQAQQLFNQMPH